MSQIETTEIAPNIFQIDTQLWDIPGFGAVYLIKAERLALMDAGDHTVAQNVLAGLRQLGVPPQEIAYIFVSHGHLDHAGAAGTLAEHMPQARVVIHERAANHYVNPQHLIQMYINFWGDPSAQTLLKAVPTSQVIPVKGGETFSLGQGEEIRVVATPGHSRDSVSYLHSKSGGLFPGDALGVYLHKEDVLFPATPPGFDLEQALASMTSMESMPLKALFLPHFSRTDRVKHVLALSRRKLLEWGEVVRRSMPAPQEELKSKLKAYAQHEAKAIEGRPSLHKFIVGDMSALSAVGYNRYFEAHQH